MTSLPYKTATVRVGRIGSTGVSITGLRVAFTIEKPGTADGNRATIVISNMAENTRNVFKTQDALIELSVGYSNRDPEVVFTGMILDVGMENNNDIDTIVKAQDGAQHFKRGRISVSYTPGTKLVSIIGDVIKKVGIGTRVRILPIPDVTFNNGKVFTGYAADLLDQLCKEFGIEWSVQNGLLSVCGGSNDLVRDAKTPIVMMGTPVRILKSKKASSSDNEFNGYTCQVELEPKLVPGDSMFLQCYSVPQGVKQKVLSLRHEGDTHGENWFTEVKSKDVI